MLHIFPTHHIVVLCHRMLEHILLMSATTYPSRQVTGDAPGQQIRNWTVPLQGEAFICKRQWYIRTCKSPWKAENSCADKTAVVQASYSLALLHAQPARAVSLQTHRVLRFIITSSPFSELFKVVDAQVNHHVYGAARPLLCSSWLPCFRRQINDKIWQCTWGSYLELFYI